MATIENSIEQLGTAWRVLARKWADTQPLWNDPVSQGFEKNYLTLFDGQTQATLKEMQQVAQVIAEAKRRVH